MNAFNRLLIVLLLLAVAAASIVVLATGLGWLDPEQLQVGFWLQEGLGILSRPDRPERIPGLVAALLALVISVLLISFELRTWRSAEPPIVVKRGPLGRVTVARSGVRRLASSEATRVPGVVEAHTAVRGKDRLRVVCRASVDPTADLPALTEQIQTRVKGALEHHIGRSVGEVRVHTQLDPLDRKRSGPRVR